LSGVSSLTHNLVTLNWSWPWSRHQESWGLSLRHIVSRSWHFSHWRKWCIYYIRWWNYL